MPRRSKRRAPAASRKNLKLDNEEEGTLQPKKTMEDLPPEVKTIILDHLTLNGLRKTVLGYRLVNCQWKDIISSLLEQRIIAGDSQLFPRMKLHCPNQREDLLHISKSPKMFQAGRNPFPSNSLILDGWDGKTDFKYLPKSVTDIERMGVADFMSRFGGYLTSFELQDVIVPGMNSLVTLLSPMTSLKVLNIQNVELTDRVIKPNGVLPTAPPLPNLTTMVVGSKYSVTKKITKYGPGHVEKSHILCVWLLASYADQLLDLTLKIVEHLPGIQRQLQYYYSFPNGNKLSIATTSDFAFRNLKELNIDVLGLSQRFFSVGDFPRLEQLTVTSTIFSYGDDFPTLIKLISNSRNSLKKLSVKVDWKSMIWESTIGEEASLRVKLEGLFQPIVPNSKLITLEINYRKAHDRSDYTIISRFLALFPALETIHFLRFPSSHVATSHKLATASRIGRSGNVADKIVAAKTRLDSLEQGLFERTRSFDQRCAEIRFEKNQVAKWKQELQEVKNAAKIEKAEILQELAALGVKKQDVMAEQFLERVGIWKNFVKLKLVSVSTGEKPVGDVCILRRPVEV